MRALWQQLEQNGEFTLAGSAEWARVQASGFVSGHSAHADRIATIRGAAQRYGYVMDTHTADGFKVGLEHREAGVPLVCLETALAAKFDEAVREAIGRSPERPAGYENIESLPQRCALFDADAQAVKRFISEQVAA